MKNYLIYPTKYMNITQNYSDSYSHRGYSTGNPKSYPIDDAGKDSGKDYFFIPCNKMVVKRVYGVGNSGINTIWLESTDKVYFANGTYDYVTILVSHPEDSDLKNIKVGKVYTKGEAIFKEGKDGYDRGMATGNHFHIDVSKGKFTGNGWVKNSKGSWTITGNSIKPEDAFYIDKSFTKIINNRGLKFKEVPTNTNNNSNNTNNTNYFKKYTGNTKSIVDALKSIKVDSSYGYRKKIASANNIKYYIGSSSQNIKMLNLLKQGKLIKP